MTPEEDLEDYQAGKEDSVAAATIAGKWVILLFVAYGALTLVTWCLS